MSKSKLHIKYRVEYADGRVFEVVAKPKDFVAFERQYNMPFYEATRFEHICYLAWAPLHRTGQEPRAFDEFLNDVDDVEEVDEEAPAPLDLTPSDAQPAG